MNSLTRLASHIYMIKWNLVNASIYLFSESTSAKYLTKSADGKTKQFRKIKENI